MKEQGNAPGEQHQQEERKRKVQLLPRMEHRKQAVRDDARTPRTAEERPVKESQGVNKSPTWGAWGGSKPSNRERKVGREEACVNTENRRGNQRAHNNYEQRLDFCSTPLGG